MFAAHVPGSRGDEQRAGRLAIKGEYLWVLGRRKMSSHQAVAVPSGRSHNAPTSQSASNNLVTRAL